MSDHRPRAFVLLNPQARGGQGEKLWSRVEPAVAAHLRPDVCPSDLDGVWREKLHRALDSGVRTFAAAGGDGTISALVDALTRNDAGVPTEELLFGAVGLGSSNDYHKPFDTVVAKVPLRVDPSSPGWRDICAVRYTDEATQREVLRHFVVSASMGITSEANAFFNDGDALMKKLKRLSTGAAIAYAALRTIAKYRNIPVRIHLGSEQIDAPMTNLCVLKTQYVSGSFRLDVPVACDDGAMGVALAHGLSRSGAIRTLLGMLRGRFVGLPGRRFESCRELVVESEAPAALELDGEVFRTRRVRFESGNRRMRTCR